MRSKAYQQQLLWEAWTRQPIFADRGVYNIAPRHVVIRDFVKNGIIPFVKRKGYIFNSDEKNITHTFLRYLFVLYQGQKVKFKNPHKKILIDHVQEFYHRFDSLEVEEFWEQWNHIQDFQEDRYGEKLRYTLPFLLWPLIDIDNSPITIKIEKIFDEIEEMEYQERKDQEKKKDPKGKEDPYLYDSSRVNYEDRHWH